MAYDQKVSRAQPGLIVILVDDSSSMDWALDGGSDSRYLWVDRYFGVIAHELMSRSTEVRGNNVVIKPRYFMNVIKYGSAPSQWEKGEMAIDAVVDAYTRAGKSLGLGGKLGGTDAAAAFVMAHDYVMKAVKDERFVNSFPTMVFHLTDGESQSDATPVANQIKSLSTRDGNVLVVNAYIGTRTSLQYSGPEDFPGYLDAKEAGPSADNLRLFEMSSVAPDCIVRNLVDDGIFPKLRDGSRLFFDVRTREMLKHVIQVVGSIGSRADRTVN